MTFQQYVHSAASLAVGLSSDAISSPERCPEDPTSEKHLSFMLRQVYFLAEEGRFEKASRWLGFVQGVLVAQGRLSLEQAKRANMPSGAEFDGERT